MDLQKASIKEILKKFAVTEEGLPNEEIQKRLIKYGKNELSETKPNGLLKKLLSQFSDFMVITLIVAAITSFVVSVVNKNSDFVDSIIIFVVVLVNAIIGVIQENQAEKAIESLKSLSKPMTKVKRNGEIKNIPSANIVPGDILVLNNGDLVTADARIIKSSNFYVEESAMTGENIPIEKTCELKGEKSNMIFSGSIVTAGNATAVVISTGMNTEIGKIASMINSEYKSQTPLQVKLAKTGKILGICIMVISVIVFLLGILQNKDIMEMFMISISLAVAAIPEGLPAVVTIVLASGIKKMAKYNAIVRKLSSIETLGHTTVICSDKTGTLTLNKMVVTEIHSVTKQEEISCDFSKYVLTLGSLCNNAVVSKIKDKLIARGEPTENAILSAAINQKINVQKILSNFERVSEIPFDSKRKLMTTVHRKSKNESLVITKGAPDILLKSCTRYYGNDGEIKNIDREIITKIKNKISKMSEKALRVIGLAYKQEPTLDILGENSEDNLIFIALIGISDPPRPEVFDAVSKCKNAGIKPVIITGDHQNTALALAKKIGIASKNTEAMTGAELNNISDKDLKKIINNYSVFARVSPEHKVKIVKAFQANGEVVAMTGDGVNDAPALKIADIGCAMGKSGTDAAKSASDIILTDDNFSTIVEAIRQGRGMYDNIKKTIHFLLSTNISEVMVVLLGFLIKVPSPLLAIHLLWINLVTDAFPALALGVEPIEKDIMKRPPENSKQSLFSGGLGYNIIVEGTFIATIGLLSYSIGRVFFDTDCSNPIIGRTMAFVTLGISQIIHTINVKSEKPLKSVNILNNVKLLYSIIFCIFLQVISLLIPTLNSFFKTAPLNFLQWVIVLSLSITPVVISESEKRIINLFNYFHLKPEDFKATNIRPKD